MLIIMVQAAQMCVGRVMINLATIHAHRPVALSAYQDGKANIAQNVSNLVSTFFDFVKMDEGGGNGREWGILGGVGSV